MYTHVDASYTTITELAVSDPANPIEEVWLWNPEISTLQFIESPQQPTSTGSQWLNWERSLGSVSDLNRIYGNQSLLVRVGGANNYTWHLKGKPVAPLYQWTTSGQNFVGFATVPEIPPTFDSFFDPAPHILVGSEIYHYVGADLGPNNPEKLFALRTNPVRRGEAFWIRSKDQVFNRYFGPFELALGGETGLDFGSAKGQVGFRLRNLTDEPLDVTLALADSETPPEGQAPIVESPPLLLRGAINIADLTFDHADLNLEPQSITLAPKGESGAETEIVIGLNRALMTGNTGDLFAGVLQLTDSKGFVRFDIPVSASVASNEGLWVGSAVVNSVRHQIKTFQEDLDGQTTLGENGAYVRTGENTSFGATARSFPLRLIVHHDGLATRLLQRVYHGVGVGAAEVLTTREELLDGTQLASARRISAAQLPWTAGNSPWTFSGTFDQGSTLEVTVDLAHDNHASNPFLHTYHPDHDSLNATFDGALPVGAESMRIERRIKLSVTPPADDFLSLTRSKQTLTGSYEETIILHSDETQSRTFAVQGGFALNRLSNISTLTLQ